MARSDSVLLTGANSGTLGKLDRAKQAEELKKQAKISKKHKIAPTIEPVLEEIDKEVQSTIMAQMDLIDGDTEDFKSMALALKLYKESCKKLKSRLSNIMRVEK